MAGRKPGGPKTGGRQKGSTNKSTNDLRIAAQEYTADSLQALVRALRDPAQAVAAAKVILAYGHGAPRAAVDVSVKPIYVMSGQPMSAEEWAAKYADVAEVTDDGNSTVSGKPVAKPKPSRTGVGAAGRTPKRSR